MNELSLFSGVGGGLLATKHLLNWNTIGYVEFNKYCQQVLEERIKEGGMLDEAPIFGDIRSFISEGYAEAYKGLVDVISAGFPCQPFSVAGAQLAKDDARNMWPYTMETIRIVRPTRCLLENVPGLLSRKHRYFETILKDLAEGGYDAIWKVISASELGAPHKRDRLFIVADAQHLRLHETKIPKGFTSRSNGDKERAQSTIQFEGCREQHEELANPDSERGRLRKTDRQDAEDAWQSPRRSEYRYWDTEPNVGRVANGVASRLDRLKACGNGQVPAVVATAWEILNV
jgi:DNA (cytosine-5)-methyltransferase 1